MKFASRAVPLLTLAPLVSLCTLGWSSRPEPDPRLLDRRRDGSSGDPAGFGRSARSRAADRAVRTVPPVGSAGAVVLSIEPTPLAPGADTEVPVVFPGYVLPDDSLEDRAHEGS